MSVQIFCNNVEILDTQNRSFDLLHETISNIIKKREIPITPYFNNFLRQTDQNIYGSGAVTADIAQFFKTKEASELLAMLVKEAIEEEKINFSNIIGCVENLNNFYRHLIEYGKTLS